MSRNFNINYGPLFERQGSQVVYAHNTSGTLFFWPITISAAIHGVPVTMSNPIGNKVPVGFIPYYALSSSDLNIDNYSFSSSTSENQIYLTFNYDLKHNEPKIFLTASSNFTVPNGTIRLGWGQAVTVGTALSWSSAGILSTSVVVKEAGDYVVHTQIEFNQDLSGTRSSYVSLNNSASAFGGFVRGYTAISATGTTGWLPILNASGLLENLVAGDLIQFNVSQNSGGTVSMLARSTKMSIYRYRNNNIPTGSVAGVLIGVV